MTATNKHDPLAPFRALLDEWETDEPGNGMLAVMGLRRALSNFCTYCGSHDDCPCDDQADQQATGGY